MFLLSLGGRGGGRGREGRSGIDAERGAEGVFRPGGTRFAALSRPRLRSPSSDPKDPSPPVPPNPAGGMANPPGEVDFELGPWRCSSSPSGGGEAVGDGKDAPGSMPNAVRKESSGPAVRGSPLSPGPGSAARP